MTFIKTDNTFEYDAHKSRYDKIDNTFVINMTLRIFL